MKMAYDRSARRRRSWRLINVRRWRCWLEWPASAGASPSGPVGMTTLPIPLGVRGAWMSTRQAGRRPTTSGSLRSDRAGVTAVRSRRLASLTRERGRCRTRRGLSVRCASRRGQFSRHRRGPAEACMTDWSRPGSSPEVGSSRRSSDGWVRSSIVTDVRFRCPPEKWSTLVRRWSDSPSSAAVEVTRVWPSALLSRRESAARRQTSAPRGP